MTGQFPVRIFGSFPTSVEYLPAPESGCGTVARPNPEVALAIRVLGPMVLALMLLSAPDTVTAQRVQLAVAMSELEARAGRDSLDPVAHYEAALGYWVDRRYDDAERELRRAVAIEPRFAPGYLALAYLPYGRKPKLWKELDKERVSAETAETIDSSARLFRRAFMLDPMVDLKVYALARPPRAALVVGFNADRTYIALVRGFEYFWAGRYDQSLYEFQRVMDEVGPRRLDELSDVLLWYHGLAAAHGYRYDTALGDFGRLLDRAIEREQSDTLVHTFQMESNRVRYVLATLYQQAGQPDRAMELYQECLTNDLGLYMAHAQLAEIHEARGQWVEAVGERRRAVEANPEDASLQYELGQTLVSSRDFPEAAEVLESAMQANPLNTRIPYTLGLVYLRLGDRERARSVLERFAARAPSRFSSQVADVRRQLETLQ